MRWRCFLISYLMITLIVTTGCWSRKELDEQAIVLAMGIDKAGEHYKVSIQVIEPEQVASQTSMSGRAPATTYEAEAVTIREALRRLTRDIPRRPMLSHLRVFIIGEQLAREGIGGIIDFLSRNSQLRVDYYLLIAKDVTAVDVLSISTELEKIPANTMYDTVQNSAKEWGGSARVTLDKLINELTFTGINPVIPGIELIGSVEEGTKRENVDSIKSPTYLIMTGLGVFKDDKLVGWLDEEGSKGYNYIKGNVVHTAGHADCAEGGHVTTETEHMKTKMKASMQNGKPHIHIELEGDVQIVDVSCKIDLLDPATIIELDKKMNQRFEKRLHKIIEKAQHEYNSDIFGFGSRIKKDEPKAWIKLVNRWDEEFPKLSVTVTSNLQIRSTGTINNSYIQSLDFPLSREVKNDER